MKFDDFDKQMRVYETSLDQYILPDIFMVARIDGRSFTKLTKKICHFDVPYDDTFRNYMVETVKHLMTSGFRIVYGYTESDEISLLFHQNEDTFGRKVRKYNSILAGEASAAFSVQLGKTAAFDCRMVPLPNIDRVKDYFLWRQEDAHRNALNSHCYWMLRKEGIDSVEATKQLEGKTVSYKNEMLFSRGVNFGKLPTWQKRGIGVYSEKYENIAVNKMTNEKEPSLRRRLKVTYDLPLNEEYAEMVEKLLV